MKLIICLLGVNICVKDWQNLTKNIWFIEWPNRKFLNRGLLDRRPNHHLSQRLKKK
jgi:hypothetical protein